MLGLSHNIKYQAIKNGLIIFYKPVMILDATLPLQYVIFDLPQ